MSNCDWKLDFCSGAFLVYKQIWTTLAELREGVYASLLQLTDFDVENGLVNYYQKIHGKYFEDFPAMRGEIVEREDEAQTIIMAMRSEYLTDTNRLELEDNENERVCTIAAAVYHRALKRISRAMEPVTRKDLENLFVQDLCTEMSSHCRKQMAGGQCWKAASAYTMAFGHASYRKM